MSLVRFQGAQPNGFRGQQRAAEIPCKDLDDESSIPRASTRFSRVGLIGKSPALGAGGSPFESEARDQYREGDPGWRQPSSSGVSVTSRGRSQQQRAAGIPCKDLDDEGSIPRASTRFSRVGLIGKSPALGAGGSPFESEARDQHREGDPGWRQPSSSSVSGNERPAPARPTPPRRGVQRAVGVRVALGRKTATTRGL